MLGDDKLNDLAFASNNLDYGDEEVRIRLISNRATNDVICPLITHSQRLYFDSGTDVADTGNLKWTSATDKGVKWNQILNMQ